MGAIWLEWLPDYLAAEGVRFRLEDGWQRRARSSGGYDAVLGVQIHHTVSKTTPRRDIDYMWYNASTRPIGSLLLDRTGLVHVGCAGATNTSGLGGPRWGSRGAIPKDNGNRNLIAVEAANDGLGEPWPPVQCGAYTLTCVALLKGATAETPGPALTAGDVHAHYEWAPLRKVDTRGPSTWAVGDLEKWNMDRFRGDVLAAMLPAELPDWPTDPKGGSVLTAFYQFQGTPFVYGVFSGGYKVWYITPESLDAALALARKSGASDKINVTASRGLWVAFGPILGPVPAGLDAYGLPS